MSVSIEEVLESAGYNIYNNLEDSEWLVSQREDIENIIEELENIIESYQDYCYECNLDEIKPMEYEEYVKNIRAKS